MESTRQNRQGAETCGAVRGHTSQRERASHGNLDDASRRMCIRRSRFGSRCGRSSSARLSRLRVRRLKPRLERHDSACADSAARGCATARAPARPQRVRGTDGGVPAALPGRINSRQQLHEVRLRGLGGTGVCGGPGTGASATGERYRWWRASRLARANKFAATTTRSPPAWARRHGGVRRPGHRRVRNGGNGVEPTAASARRLHVGRPAVTEGYSSSLPAEVSTPAPLRQTATYSGSAPWHDSLRWAGAFTSVPIISPTAR